MNIKENIGTLSHLLEVSIFVIAGIGVEKFCKDVMGQSILGEDEFIERFLKHVKGYEEVKEIPKSQRYIGRPGLAELLKGTKRRKEINRKAKEVLERYVYR